MNLMNLYKSNAFLLHWALVWAGGVVQLPFRRTSIGLHPASSCPQCYTGPGTSIECYNPSHRRERWSNNIWRMAICISHQWHSEKYPHPKACYPYRSYWGWQTNWCSVVGKSSSLWRDVWRLSFRQIQHPFSSLGFSCGETNWRCRSSTGYSLHGSWFVQRVVISSTKKHVPLSHTRWLMCEIYL